MDPDIKNLLATLNKGISGTLKKINASVQNNVGQLIRFQDRLKLMEVEFWSAKKHCPKCKEDALTSSHSDAGYRKVSCGKCGWNV